MAETNTTTQPSVKKYYDYAQQQIDEQAILDKYNAATTAQYNLQREQNRLAENQFYNQMYNTQRTAMDTIRQANAAAVSSGASRGVQAANELSSLLGLQQESVASATELAQASRQTAQEETAAVLENVLNAYQQASQERSQLTSQAIESASVDVEQAANQATIDRANYDALQSAAKEGTAAYFAELANQGYDYATNYSAQGEQALNLALNTLSTELANADSSKAKDLISRFDNSLQTMFGIKFKDLFPNLSDSDFNKLMSDSMLGSTIVGAVMSQNLISNLYRNQFSQDAYRNSFTQNNTGV